MSWIAHRRIVLIFQKSYFSSPSRVNLSNFLSNLRGNVVNHFEFALVVQSVDVFQINVFKSKKIFQCGTVCLDPDQA